MGDETISRLSKWFCQWFHLMILQRLIQLTKLLMIDKITDETIDETF
ncbi:9984_t:CDS:1, partial [Ambispora leptoticha]